MHTFYAMSERESYREAKGPTSATFHAENNSDCFSYRASNGSSRSLNPQGCY